MSQQIICPACPTGVTEIVSQYADTVAIRITRRCTKCGAELVTYRMIETGTVVLAAMPPPKPPVMPELSVPPRNERGELIDP